MTHRITFASLALAAAIALVATPASAQQSLNFQVGSFAARGAGSRMSNDVLIANQQYLSFDLRDLRNATVSADWSFLLGEYFELGVGVGYFQRAIPSVYADYVNSDGSEIEQQISLRIVPVTALVKLLPLGGFRHIQPYVGGGLSVYFWRYSEIGDFVNLSDNSIFSDRYIANGTSVGPVGVGGVRIRVAQNATIGVEGRYQWGRGTLSTDSFLSDRIDLGGASALATFGYRF